MAARQRKGEVSGKDRRVSVHVQDIIFDGMTLCGRRTRSVIPRKLISYNAARRLFPDFAHDEIAMDNRTAVRHVDLCRKCEGML